MNKIFKVGLIGCGHISETYFRGHDYFNNFQIIKCADINIENAKKCAETYGIEACAVDELLNDSEVEIILNLTIPRAHYEVAKKSLEHGKHVYSEKPMAVNFVEGEELLNLANSKNLYIGNAPDTFLGGGIQKSIDLINQDKIGNVLKKGNLILTGAYGLPIPINDKNLIEVTSSLFGNVSAVFK